MADSIRTGASPLRLLDDSAVAARHIVRSASSAPGAVKVMPGQWWAPAAAAGVNGLEGDQGWVSATTEHRLSDHGLLSAFTLPNAPGADGIEHKARFAVRTGRGYRLGDEWIELSDRASQRTLAVATPTNASAGRASVSLTGVDAAGLLSGWREGPVAPIPPSAPQDVIEYYSRAPRARLASQFATSPPSLQGWSVSAGAPVATIEGVRLPAGAAISRSEDGEYINNQSGRSIRVAIRLDNTTGLTSINITWSGQALTLRPLPSTAQWGVSVTARTGSTTREFSTAAAPRTTRDTLEVAIHARDGWAFVTIDGQVAAAIRHVGGSYDARGVTIQASGASPAAITVREVQVRTMTPLLRRAVASIDYRLPGAPPPGGLTGDYYLEPLTSVTAPEYASRIASPFAEPYESRVDPQIDFTGAAWMPPGPPNGMGFAVRWHGAIYLDLATSDIHLAGGWGDMGRVWVGSTRADRAYDGSWPDWATTRPGLRQHLGTSLAGWYPIVMEVGKSTLPPAVRLARSTNGGATWETVPSSALSPYGCWSGDVAGQSHREIIDAVCQSTGLQWRSTPRSLESGAFPGQLEYAPVGSLGYQSDLVIGEDTATEYQSEVDASESCNRVHADAAGLGRPDGSDQGLTAEILDPDATEDPWLITRYEQMADITVEALMQQRLDALLGLYSSPHEQVSARPRGTEELVHEWGDAFPTTSSARMILWEPGDGARLVLPSIGVEDLTPRQMAAVQTTLRPAGRLAPVVGWRQRPRWLRERLRTLARQSAAQRQSYQGQLAQLMGSVGGGAGYGGVDVNTRLLTPIGRVVRLEVIVAAIVGSGVLVVNGLSTGVQVTRSGAYDVTAWLAPASNSQYATISGATGQWTQLVATVTV